MSKICIYGIIVQLSLFTFVFATSGEAQTKSVNEITVSIDLRDPIKLDILIETMENATGFSFSHIKQEFNTSSYTLMLDSREYILGDLLRTVASQTDLSFHRVNEYIQIRKKELGVDPVVEEIRINQIVTGTVTDENGEPLPGATILQKGTTNGTITDVEGNFSLNVTEDAVLLVSFVGYRQVEVTVGSQTTISVSMKPDLESLQEVVVIGYGQVKKSDLTGSVASVGEKDFIKSPIATNVDLLIQGKAAGVNIMQTNPQPGGATRIQIRGTTSVNASNEPLYVIDGLPIDNRVLNAPNNNLTANSAFTPPPANPLNTINPSDIASIEILKDASATAIYGSRGANGVILITTKKGSSGAPTINYNATFGFQKIAKSYDLLNASEYATLYNEYYDFYQVERPTDPIFANSVVKKFTPSEIAALDDNSTDWFNVLTRNGSISSHQLSLNGGSNLTTYYASVGYTNQGGVIEGSDFERLNSRLNITQKLGSVAELGVNLSVANAQTGNIPIGTADVGDTRGGAMIGVTSWSPTIEPFNPDGTVRVHPFTPQSSNPVGLLLGDFESENNRTLVNTYLKVNLTDGLFAKVSAGYDKSIDNTTTFVPSEAKNSLAANGEATKGSYINTSHLADFLLVYKKTFGSSTIDLTGGTSYQAFDFESLYGKSYGFTTSAFRANNLAAASNQLTFSGKSTSNILSYLGRANYSLNDKYLLTASFRYDGSSKFAEGNKWGFFPSAAVAWKLGEEGFVKNLNIFSTLKIRASWGRTGNQNIGTNNSQPLLGALQFGTIGDAKVTPIGPVSPGNSDLTWETTTQTDIGIDFGILEHRLSGTIDFYNTVTTDLLLNFQLPRTSGFNSVVRNAGSIQNQGIEVSLIADILTGDFGWTASPNFSRNINSWKDRAGLPYGIQNEHGPLGGLYGYKVEGIFQSGEDIANSAQPLSQAGQFKFVDVRGRDENNELTNTPDGEINADDRVFLGNSRPTTILGFTNTFTYKNFTMNLFFQGMFDFVIYNATKASLDDPFNLFYLRGVGSDARNYWNSNNPTNEVQSGVPNPYGSQVNTIYVEKGDFVRLKNIYLGYDIPLDNKIVSRANVFVSVDNALLFTQYKGLDPETALPVNTKSGSESDVYPNTRTYSLGVNLTF